MSKEPLVTLPVKPAIVIWHTVLREFPLWQLDRNNKDENAIAASHDKLRVALGLKHSDTKQFFQITMMGYYFTFSVNYVAQVNPRKYLHWEIVVWDITGSRSVCGYEFPSTEKEADIMPKEIWSKIIADCEDFVRDIQKCSGCGKKVKKHEIAGHYFAGSYCKECWEGKYKAIEAAENYN